MKTSKRKLVKAAGWKVGAAKDFLGLTPKEAAFGEFKLTLSRQNQLLDMKAAITTPYAVSHLPFANEDEMQGFVEEHAEQIFGLEVIASSSRGGELFEMDVLAVNASNMPFIIECKWDLVGSGAMSQLEGYRKKLLDNWPSFLKRVNETRGRPVAVSRREAVLIAIGYRYAPLVLREAQSVVCLTYAYHPGTLTVDALEQQRPGKVSIQHAHQIPMPTSPHPTVSKKHITLEKLSQLPPALQKAFSAIDDRLCRLDAVKVLHGKKVRYRVPRAGFAEAKIGRKSIQWRYCKSGEWKDGGQLDSAACDADKVFDLLRQAHVDAT